MTGEKDWSGVVVPTLTTPAVQLGPCIYRSRSGQSVSVGVFAPEAKDAAELLSQAEASSSSRRAVSVPGLGIAAFVFPVASLPGFNNLSLTVLTATHEIVVDGSIPAGQLEALAGRVIASEHGR